MKVQLKFRVSRDHDRFDSKFISNCNLISLFHKLHIFSFHFSFQTKQVAWASRIMFHVNNIARDQSLPARQIPDRVHAARHRTDWGRRLEYNWLSLWKINTLLLKFRYKKISLNGDNDGKRQWLLQKKLNWLSTYSFSFTFVKTHSKSKKKCDIFQSYMCLVRLFILCWNFSFLLG